MEGTASPPSVCQCRRNRQRAFDGQRCDCERCDPTKEGQISTTTDQQPSSAETPSTTSSREMQYWVTSRRGPVEIAAFSNPPHNYLTKGVIDELQQLVVEWRDPSIRAVVIQSHDQDAGFFTQYSVEELDGLASDP